MSWAQQLERWHDFHVLAGTAGATLMGLTFVAVSLAPDVIAQRTTTAVRAFTTPIVAFFATILIVSIVLLVPGLTRGAAAAFFALVGASGVVYIFVAGVHRQWREFGLGIDDWIWYVGLPLLGYAALLAEAVAIWRTPSWGLYGSAVGALVLLIVGIRNAWDVVIAMTRQASSTEPPDLPSSLSARRRSR